MPDVKKKKKIDSPSKKASNYSKTALNIALIILAGVGIWISLSFLGIIPSIAEVVNSANEWFSSMSNSTGSVEIPEGITG